MTVLPKKPLRTLIALLFCTSLAPFLLPAEGIGVQVDAAWYGSVPSSMHEDDLPVRTHLSLGGTLEPIIVDISDHLSISSGLSIRYTTRSIPYGSVVWSPFIAAGPSIALTLEVTPVWSVSTALALLGGIYLHTWELAPYLRCAITPEYVSTPQDARHTVAVSFPIAADLRTDYFALSAGIGVRWYYDFYQESK